MAIAIGCSGGPTRSTEAFCATLKDEKQRILSQLERNGNPHTDDSFIDTFAGFGASVQAFGELRTYFNRLEEHAPDEIRPEMEIIASSTASSSTTWQASSRTRAPTSSPASSTAWPCQGSWTLSIASRSRTAARGSSRRVVAEL
jgi:hypothetical protein